MVANLRLFPNLDTLKLSNSNLTSKAIESITGMTKLRELWIDHTQVDDMGMTSLGKLGALEMLRIANTQVTGSGLAELKRLPELIELDLASYPIAEAHLKAPHQFKQFRRLYLLEVKAGQDTWIALIRRRLTARFWSVLVERTRRRHLVFRKSLAARLGPHFDASASFDVDPPPANSHRIVGLEAQQNRSRERIASVVPAGV